MIELSIAEPMQWPMPEEKTHEILQAFLTLLGHAERHLSVYLTDDQEMKELNRQYRGIDQPTDVLSWSYWEQDPDSEYLGDLSISLDRVKEQATMNGWDDETELIRLLAHGCAHLVGYDHEQSREADIEMLKIEIRMLGCIGMGTLYPSATTDS